MSPLLALGAAFAATILALTAKAIAHTLTLWAVTVLWAVALWAGRRHRAALYHRHGREGVTHHRRPTRRHRVWVAVVRLRHLHLTTSTAARTAS